MEWHTVVIPLLRRGHSEILQACWPVSCVYLACSRLVRETGGKKGGGGREPKNKTQGCPVALTCMNIHIHKSAKPSTHT